MCSLLCSSDVIAAVSLVSFEKEPDLYSIIFGEGITNDAVSIILFNTVMKYTSKTGKEGKVSWSTPFNIIINFKSLGFWSLCMGIVFALWCAWLLKNYRSFSKNATNEVLIIFCYGYIAYILSEVSENSGIITLLTCGIVMSHYTWYNLSPQGKHASFITFEFLSFGMEGFVFIYLGVTLFSFGNLRWSWDLFIVELMIIMIGRFIGTVGFV
jgi:NhaP-type Na+/H+ or K+/H+ antiporter